MPSTHYSPLDIRFIAPRVLELTYTAYDLQSFAEDILAEIGVDQWNAWFPQNPITAGSSPLPFPWDEARRATLRAELDAYYARLYGLNRKQLRYILDPADLTPRELEDILDPWEEVSDPLDPAGYDARRAASDFPGETFRVLKEKELKQFGEYRTRRLVLEAWNRLEGLEARAGQPDPIQPKQEAITLTQPRPQSVPTAVQTPPPVPVKPEKPAQPETLPAQPSLSDFGLYKCELCRKLVMGYEKANHEQEKHGGKSVVWKKIR